MSEIHGKFVWYDVMTTDTKAAETFYHNVIGWDAKDSGMPDQSYTLLSVGSEMVAGLMPIPDDAKAMGVPPCWTGYIAVDDVDDYATRVVAAGGAIRKPATDIPGVGRFAVVADPYGAVFLLFKGTGEGPTPDAMGTQGHVGWHELYTGDLDGAFKFYSGLFGWTKGDAIDMGPMGIYQIFATGGASCGGMMKRPAEMPVSAWLYYFNVAAVDATMARVTENGGTVLNGPMEVPGGAWIVQCKDPQGAMFAFVGMTR